jgi:hypothetical protein
MTKLRLYRFQTKLKLDSIDDKLAIFLKLKEGDLTEKERVWQALSAFWLPHALIESGAYTDKEIARYGLNAITRLRSQIMDLRLILSLQVPNYAHLFGTDLASSRLESSTSGSNGARAHQRNEVKIKSYTELDGLDIEKTCQADIGDVSESDLTNLEQTHPSIDTNQFGKLFIP